MVKQKQRRRAYRNSSAQNQCTENQGSDEVADASSFPGVSGLKPVADADKINGTADVAVAKHSTDKLLDKAEELVSSLQYDLAEKFCLRALQQSPDDERVLTTTGIVYVESGNLEKAKEYLQLAVEKYPNSDYTQFLYLAQLQRGADAAQNYEKALQLMKKQIEAQKLDHEESSEKVEVYYNLFQLHYEWFFDNSLPGAFKDELCGSDLSSVHCALAELYLTDLCDEPDAEQKCENQLRRALRTDSQNADAHQTFASFLISAQRTEEAVEMLAKCTAIWLPQLTEVMNDQTGNTVNAECPLDFEARVKCAKLLIEVEQHATAEQVLDTVLAENDEDVEPWYLYGWCNYLQGEEKFSEAKAYLKHALETAKKTKCKDADMLKHIRDLMVELSQIPEAADDQLSEDGIADGDISPELDDNVEMEESSRNEDDEN